MGELSLSVYLSNCLTNQLPACMKDKITSNSPAGKVRLQKFANDGMAVDRTRMEDRPMPVAALESRVCWLRRCFPLHLLANRLAYQSARRDSNNAFRMMRCLFLPSGGSGFGGGRITWVPRSSAACRLDSFNHHWSNCGANEMIYNQISPGKPWTVAKPNTKLKLNSIQIWLICLWRSLIPDKNEPPTSLTTSQCSLRHGPWLVLRHHRHFCPPTPLLRSRIHRRHHHPLG